jgi:hypothetical protein
MTSILRFLIERERAGCPAHPALQSLINAYLGVTRKMPHKPFVNWKLSCVR